MRGLRSLTRPPVVISIIGIAGFAIDMVVKPISNAGLVLLLAAAAPWLLKTIKRLKVGDYIEFENLTPSETERKLTAEAEELLDSQDSEKLSVDDHAVVDSGLRVTSSCGVSEKFSLRPDSDRLREAIRHVALTEKYVLDWLEGQLGVEIRREVRVGGVMLDAVAMTKPEPTLIEIKAIRSAYNISRRLREAFDHLAAASKTWFRAHGTDTKLMVILSTPFTPDEVEYEAIIDRVSEIERRSAVPVSIKVITASDIGLLRSS